MTADEIRKSFLKFFEEHGHRIVPSASVIPYDDPTLLFTNAGMNQFKDVFLGTGKREYVRAADSQKCIRVSGKHNDLEEVGRDTYHHTFFEMLGNWSFGDYYKKEAIEWAWELLTKVWGLDKKRLYATVFETDDESENLWKKVTDIDRSHVLRFGKKDNFWEMGETGPCGPCSEIHFDLTDDLSGGNLVNAGDPRVMEIWNLVFIQYDRDAAGKLTPLPAKHVDTGMGFERICAILQGKKSNYDTDVFSPIIKRIEDITGKSYTIADVGLPISDSNPQSPIFHPPSEINVAMRVIADHVRMLAFSIADGGIPSNEGRGYVMRRILRRAARFGRTLDMHEPFIYKVVEAVVKSMCTQFPEIKEKQNQIERVIKAEEESFNHTLDKGLKIFEEIASDTLYNRLRDEGYSISTNYDKGTNERIITILGISKESQTRNQNYLLRTGKIFIGSPTKEFDDLGSYSVRDWNSELSKKYFATPLTIRGKDVFKLYDTFGFPPDLTALIAKDWGFEIDQVEFDQRMANQKISSQLKSEDENKGWDLAVQYKGVHIPTKNSALGFTSDLDAQNLHFIGYDYLEGTGTVVKSDRAELVVDSTPFYGASGGQVGDEGIIEFDGLKLKIINTLKANEIVVHALEKEIDLPKGKIVRLMVNEPRRLNIMRNHTATHLVHEALRRVLGEHLHQQGSLVAPDHLRFDFNHFEKINPEQLKAIEEIVNEKISQSIDVIALNDPKDWLTIEEAKKKYPNVKMFFGEKYGDKVRVVQVPDFCAELCGGTHVKNTKDIGLFKIISESSVASGIRRIEAVTGEGLNLYIQKQLARVGELDERLARLAEEQEQLEKELGVEKQHKFSPVTRTVETTSHGNITIEDVDGVERMAAQKEGLIEQVSKSTNDLKKELSKVRVKGASSTIDAIVANSVSIDGFKVASGRIEAASMDELKSVGDTLRSKLSSGIGVLGAVVDEKVALVCVVTDDLVKKLQAGKIVGELAKLVGGGGGGRPHVATAGGKDISKLDEALRATPSIVQSMLK